MMRAQFKPQDAPQTRVGICCGDACRAKQQAAGTWNYAPLFKIPGFLRYRCESCYKIETGLFCESCADYNPGVS